MKTVTITVEDAVLEWARSEAAKSNISISRLVGQIIAEKMRSNHTYATAMNEALKFEPIAFEDPYLTRD